ncbi:MAG TPA: DNA adenine methylase [Candidatus Angelobacter sp.]|jgi:adenine-specific DNA methylase
MKFMGSKRWMLQNGLGKLIAQEVQTAARFVDLFSGSGAVSTHVATKYSIPVSAYDLQTFSTVLAKAVVGRDIKIEAERVWQNWYGRAKTKRDEFRPPSAAKINRAVVQVHRSWCAKQDLLLTKSYGGHYFSARQAVWLDSLRLTLPKNELERIVALSALIQAASMCAAAPGHTAQPFQPTRTAKPFLFEAWRKNMIESCKANLFTVAAQHAKIRGISAVADANEIVKSARKGDLFFIDPPYSGVHYSRFYHVLETLARGKCSNVSGIGRYPIPEERPRSKYSLQAESSQALENLFQSISSRGGRAIVTFPLRRCSNGLSGTIVSNLAKKYFETEQFWVSSKFSTLGGNNDHRYARKKTRELILVLNPQ